MEVKFTNIPNALSSRRQWVLWKTIDRSGKPTKIPFQENGTEAKSNDPATWTDFDTVAARYCSGGFDGLGYVFSEDDTFVGIDLDGCRNSATGATADWAKKIILDFQTYAEVSPSQTGVKLFAIGKLPFSTGKKKELSEDKISDKNPAIEVYDHARYFALTGRILFGMPNTPVDCQKQIDALCKRYWPVKAHATPKPFVAENDIVERARKYVAKMPGAISGSGGHNAAFHVACVLALGFGLSEEECHRVFSEYNQRCEPAWSEQEIRHKITSATAQPGQRNYLRDATPEQFNRIRVPTYRWEHTAIIRKSDLNAASNAYIERISKSDFKLMKLGIPDLDNSIGGGVEAGEMVVIGARSGHGKSLCALQIMHNVSLDGMPCLIISEEMSHLALGKRAIQYASGIPEESWRHQTDSVLEDIEKHFAVRAPVYIVESCGTAERAIEQIEDSVKNHNVKVVAIDYMQFLKSKSGSSSYEKVSNASTMLRQVCSQHGLVLIALVQLNRDIEKRPKFVPKLSDIRDSGQLEQDADVVVFVVWPHKMDSKASPHGYQLFVAKNRNRAINASVVECRIEPSRQRIVAGYGPSPTQFDPREYYGPGADG